MNTIHGVSAFGLKDCTAPRGSRNGLGEFFLADAVLPKSAFGVIRTGSEAEEERIHSGVSWPPEARVERGKPLRRVPIPVAWSLLVDAADQPVRWKIGEETSFPVASILAAHVKGVLGGASSPDSENTHAVVAIPDHLDEYGQEALLRALGNGAEQFSLLWRPVAAAMTWLDSVKLKNVEPDDWMLVIYLGPDGVEFTPFGLRVRTHEEREYILPVRNRPKHDPGPPGWEWACALVSLFVDGHKVSAEDYGAFWQAFTNFPEVWNTIAQTEWDTTKLPRPWSLADGWRLWNPRKELQDEVWDCPVNKSPIVGSLIKSSCSLEKNQYRKSTEPTWGLHLKNELKTVATNRKEGQLRGVVLCGSLASREAPQRFILDTIKFQVTAEPSPDTIWLATGCDDPIATGARLFGERKAAGQPTYLDTLPNLALLTQNQNGYALDWVDIVEAKECDGGEEYQNKIEGKFFLPKENDKIEVYLRKEKRENASERPNLPETKLPKTFIDPIIKRIKELGSFESVERYHGWESNEEVKSFALGYARHLYWEIDVLDSPFRHGEVPFSAAPKKEDTPLTVQVKMRPASGLAKVEFIPADDSLFKSRAVLFDYSRMKKIGEKDLPTHSLGWPEDINIEVTPDPEAFNDAWFARFINSSVSSDKYYKRLDDMKKALCSKWNDGPSRLSKINETGTAGSNKGKEVVVRIKQHLAKDAADILKKFPPDEHARYFIVRASWLWGGTPKIICDYLENYLKQHDGKIYDRTWNNLVEAGGRCFTKPEQFSLLFEAIYGRATSDNCKEQFPIQSLRSIINILTYRKYGYTSLTNQLAYEFIGRSVSKLEAEVKKAKNSFKAGAGLFLCLLKYRQKERKFMSLEDNESRRYFDSMQSCLQEAMKTNKDSKIREYSQGIIDYIEYKGKRGLIGVLIETDGEDNDK